MTFVCFMIINSVRRTRIQNVNDDNNHATDNFHFIIIKRKCARPNVTDNIYCSEYIASEIICNF